MAEEVIDDLDLPRAKTLASTAASRGQIVSNHEKGRARRIDSGSLAKWMFELRKANLAEDIEVVVPMRRWRASR